MQMGSPKFTSMNYGGIVYSKTGIGFHYLKDYLGEELLTIVCTLTLTNGNLTS